MKRAVIFAHYDKDSIIDDYVIYYIENLKKVADVIVFVSCNDLAEAEKNKLNVNHIISEEHKEYDFGSYKRGFFYLKENNMLNDIDELIFANDSCYAPLFPFEDMFDKMEKEQCDFWGVTKNNFGIKKDSKKNKYCRAIRPHIQSYFLVFRNKVIHSDIFWNFINNIKIEDNKNDIIINYEIGLSEILTKYGLKSQAYIKNNIKSGNVPIYKWKKLIINNRFPFIKCSIVREYNFVLVNSDDWDDVIIKHTNYPIKYIYSNLERTKYLRKHRKCTKFIKNIYFFIKRRIYYILDNYF